MNLEIIENNLEYESETLLFVHGAYHGAWCWKEKFFDFFQEHGIKCYAVSLRGHGNSEGKEQINNYEIEDYVNDVIQVINTLKLNSKPVLIGHSLGGAVVQKTAAKLSDKIDGMVLLASVPPKGMLMSLLRLLFKHSKEAKAIMNYNPEQDYNLIAKLFFSEEMALDEAEYYAKKMTAESEKASRQSVSTIVEKNILPSTMPILIMGAKNDVMLTNRQTKKIGKFYQRDVEFLERSGHDLMLDVEWEKVANRILSFVKQEVNR